MDVSVIAVETGWDVDRKDARICSIHGLDPLPGQALDRSIEPDPEQRVEDDPVRIRDEPALEALHGQIGFDGAAEGAITLRIAPCVASQSVRIAERDARHPGVALEMASRDVAIAAVVAWTAEDEDRGVGTMRKYAVRETRDCATGVLHQEVTRQSEPNLRKLVHLAGLFTSPCSHRSSLATRSESAPFRARPEHSNAGCGMMDGRTVRRAVSMIQDAVMKAKIEHLGIAVPTLAEGEKLWRELLGFPELFRETVESERVNVVGLDAGGTVVELLEPTSPESTIAKHLEKRGPGLHHIAIEVSDLGRLLPRLKASGVKLLDEVPRPGSRGTKVAFIHPKGALGVLVELVEHSAKPHP